LQNGREDRDRSQRCRDGWPEQGERMASSSKVPWGLNGCNHRPAALQEQGHGRRRSSSYPSTEKPPDAFALHTVCSGVGRRL
jgi:hypothetical protein